MIGVVVELKVSLKEKETAKQVNEIRVFCQAGRKCLVVKEKIYTSLLALQMAAAATMRRNSFAAINGLP